MDWIEPESFGLFCPDFADELVWRESLEGFEPAAEIVCGDEVGEMLSELVVVVVVEALDGRVLDRAVQIGPSSPPYVSTLPISLSPSARMSCRWNPCHPSTGKLR